jgi:hypothetical protein
MAFTDSTKTATGGLMTKKPKLAGMKSPSFGKKPKSMDARKLGGLKSGKSGGSY